MKRVPDGRDVGRALAGTLREVDKCLEGLNKQASQLTARGRYDEVEPLIRAGRTIGDFRQRLDSFRGEWRSIQALNDEDESGTTPLWRTYAPILRALVALGGSASRGELVEYLSSSSPGTGARSNGFEAAGMEASSRSRQALPRA